MLEILVQRGNLPPPPQNDVVNDTDEFMFHCVAEVEDDEGEVEIMFVEAGGVEQQQRTAKSTRDAAKETMKRRKTTIGFHHGTLNPLPSDFVGYPRMNLQQMISMWLMGSSSEGIIALRQLNSKNVNYFDKEGANLSRMRRLMAAVEHYARLRGVWKPDKVKCSEYWNGATMTKLWEGVWFDLKPLLETVTTSKDTSKPTTKHKSRPGDLRWRSCHDKLADAGIFKGLGI